MTTFAISMPCLGMMQPLTEFKKFNELPKEITSGPIPENLDAPTRRNYSATCHALRQTISIEDKTKLQKADLALSGNIAFRLASFTGEAHDDFCSVYTKNYDSIKILFKLADAKMTPQDALYAKRSLLEATMPKSRVGAKHWMGMGILRTAIRDDKKNNEKFAIDLIKANPHGFCQAYPGWGGESEMLFHITVLSPEHGGVSYAEVNKYAKICKEQPIYTPIKKSGDCTIL